MIYKVLSKLNVYSPAFGYTLSFQCFKCRMRLPASRHCLSSPGFPLPGMLLPCSSHGWLPSYISRLRSLPWPGNLSTVIFPHYSWAPCDILYCSQQLLPFNIICLGFIVFLLPLEGKLHDDRASSVLLFNTAFYALCIAHCTFNMCYLFDEYWLNEHRAKSPFLISAIK